MAGQTEEPWTIRRVLTWTTEHLKKHHSDSPRLDAELLLAHALGCQRIQLYTNFDTEMSEDQRTVMRGLVQRRSKAEPVAYLIGHREFFSLDFKVTRDVLIPRPDTETLVMETLDLLKDAPPDVKLLELGTGSGCISIAIGKHHSGVRITATDICPAALEIARENAAKHGLSDRIEFLQGDLFAALKSHPGPRFHLLLSNPPYVTSAEMATLPPDIRLHEPSVALDGGSEGLNYLRRIADEAPNYLDTGGHVLVELAPEQAERMRDDCFSAAHWTGKKIVKDSAGHPRVVLAQLRD